MSKGDTFANTPAQSSLGYFCWAVKNPPSDPTTQFTGKTVLITGANTGIGFEAALKLAKLGAAKIILGVRSIQRGEAAKKRIQNALGPCFKPDLVELVELDMMQFSSVEAFAHQVSNKFPKIHAAILNAGIAPVAYNTSDDKWESSLQTNVLSTAYLAILLLPKLRQTAKSSGYPTHLEFVASNGHGDVNVASVQSDSNLLEKVNNADNFNMLKQYSITKLLEMYVVRELAAKVSSSEVIVVSVCPGLCKSDIARDAPWAMRKMDAVWKALYARSPEEGSRTLVSGILLEESAHGGFWTNDRRSTLASYATYIGLNLSQGALASAIFNLGQGVGRPLVEYFSDQLGRINMAGFVTMIAGILTLAMWVTAKSYAAFISYLVLEGLVGRTFWATIVPLMAEVICLRDVPSGMSILWPSIVLPAMFSEPIRLQIVAGTRSYLGTQLFAEFMYLAAAACLLVLRGWKISADATCMSESESFCGVSSSADANKTVHREALYGNLFKWQRV
ncbi:hypothetical protein NM208_g15434 [Fusarium decemcellulare]|uniref:Uncharacterized protein n=1 Tax=Fusarium decemcellulare TaxID=57161 RepID=A0ACC1REI1_9HYPO|nr:hypothetical protein NM208_g15434 [Fusarium decemcellulare]